MIQLVPEKETNGHSHRSLASSTRLTPKAGAWPALKRYSSHSCEVRHGRWSTKAVRPSNYDNHAMRNLPTDAEVPAANSIMENMLHRAHTSQGRLSPSAFSALESSPALAPGHSSQGSDHPIHE
jgi:hypothetical protein